MNHSEAVLAGSNHVQREQDGGRAIQGKGLQQGNRTVNAEDSAWREINPEGLPYPTRHVEFRGNLQASLDQRAANQSESFVEWLLHDEGRGIFLAGHGIRLLPFIQLECSSRAVPE
jgi:hypothetical protein